MDLVRFREIQNCSPRYLSTVKKRNDSIISPGSRRLDCIPVKIKVNIWGKDVYGCTAANEVRCQHISCPRGRQKLVAGVDGNRPAVR